jgi:hypothetical protein
MKSLADGLPPEIARQVHADWRKNEAAYWAVRDRILGQYQGQWIAFADGAVIAACKTSLEVLHTPGVVQRHPFVICVGREDEPYRIRRATFAYDPTYPGQPFPCQLLADFAGRERILGRDVLNRLEILFRGPVGEVVVNP